MKYFSRRWVALLSVSILLSSVALAQATLKFHLTDLGVMNGYKSAAYAINNLGQVVGDYWMSNGEQRCFLYSGGAWQDLAIRGATSCHASAINDVGQIAGQHATALRGNPSYAFRLDPPSGLTVLKPLQGTNSSGAGISPSGVVVGVMDTPSGTSHAARWDPSGSITDLGYQCPYCYSSASAINSRGIIVGWTNPGGLTAFSLATRRGMQLLTGLGGNFSRANAINANGDIAGESADSLGGYNAALWLGGNVIDLGMMSTPGVSWETYATAISIDKWIVGSSLSSQAFLVVPDPGCGDIHDLTALLDSSGAGWNLGSATGINDYHQIVGWGWAPGGETHAFLLTPNKNPLCYPS